MPRRKKWSDQELMSANLVHGPDSANTDTYRLHIEGEGDKAGKMLDVPGWMVGDIEATALRVRAAAIIRQRLNEKGPT